MSQTLMIDQERQGKRAIVRLNGQIDEDADYSKVETQGVDEMVFDFSGVTLVNSSGLQKWIAFLSAVPAAVNVRFDRCPPRIVKQIDMFPGFLANRAVTFGDFYAPYYCEACDKPADILLDARSVPALDRAPPARCPDCGADMEFDAVEKKYFLFLRHAKSA